MRYYSLIFLFFISIVGSATSCAKDKEIVLPNENTTNSDTTMSNKITLSINSQTFTAVLFDNNSARAFKAMLPMTIIMIELNGNEMYFDLPGNLPTNSSKPGTIQTGDLMLYGSNTLVLFFKTFSTSYNYTKLGQLDNPSGLASALGSGNTTVTFELQ